jgi:hypothetical protein
MQRSALDRARWSIVVVGSIVLATIACGGPASAGSSKPVRGFDGSTITVAGMGIKEHLGRAEIGARARFKRFNDTNEIPGIKIEFTELAEDHSFEGDPTLARQEASRLVSSGAFAIVPDISQANPEDFFAKEHVPYFGPGMDATYCSAKPTTTLWGYSTSGCIQNPKPSFISDVLRSAYDYVSDNTEKKHPTLYVLSSDTESFAQVASVYTTAAEGLGFDVVGATNEMPLQPNFAPDGVDRSPYAKAAATSANGSQPDVILCLGADECLTVYPLVKASGFTNTFMHSIYYDILAGLMSGSAVNIDFGNLQDNNVPGVKQMVSDVVAYSGNPKEWVELGVFMGYTSADMFIQALKIAAKQGTENISPESVRKAASTMTWEIEGLQGPIKYPKSTVMGWPACRSVLLSDGQVWNTVAPYACSNKTYSPKRASK